MIRVLSRREFAAAAAGLLGGTAGGFPQASAATYPNRPVRMMVGFAPGGGADLVARIVAEGLSTRIGQQVVVENKTGASTAISLEYVARAAPDGYVLAYATADGTSILSALKPKLQYDVATDFTYLSRVAELDYVLAVNGGLPHHSLADLIVYARNNPGKIRYGTIGVGSSTHLATLLLAQQAGVSMTNVPYRGGAAVLSDLLSGFIDIGLLTTANIAEYRNTDAIGLLAVTSAARDPALPDVPTMAECGYPGATMTVWQGILAPKALPPPVANILVSAIQACLADPANSSKLLNLGFRPSSLTGVMFQQAILSETATWKAVAQKANLILQ